MKLLVLVSCFCLQLASAPAAKAFCLDGHASLKAPDSASVETQVSVLESAEPLGAGFVSPPEISSAFFPELFASFPGSKEFFIRTGLSPPLVIG